jgi:hypothetical protein
MTIHRWARRSTLLAAVLAVVLPYTAGAASGDAWTRGFSPYRAPEVATIQPVPEICLPAPPPPVDLEGDDR